jgi:hypothetical protein
MWTSDHPPILPILKYSSREKSTNMNAKQPHRFPNFSTFSRRMCKSAQEIAFANL